MYAKKIDWRFQITIIAAALGILTPVALWLIDKRPTSLKMQIASVTQLAPHVEAGVSGVQIAIDGRQLTKPYLTVLEIINDGSRAIPASDFAEPIMISVEAGSKIVRGDFSKSDPIDISPVINNEEGSLKLQPLLLNSSDRITLAVVTEGGEPKFSIKTRIVNISSVQVVDSSNRDKSVGAMIRRAVLAAGLLMAYVSIFLAYLPFGPRIRIGALFGCSIATVCGLSAAEMLIPIIRHYEWGKYSVVVFTTIMVSGYAMIRLRMYRRRQTNHRIVLPLGKES